jgi:hypothetical protein
VSCTDPVTDCRFQLAGKDVVLRFSETPRPMQPFVLEVIAAGAVAVAADFSMQDMEMLPNRYQLTRTPDGPWQARVVLPVCVSGRSDWQLILAIDDERASIPFAAGR